MKLHNVFISGIAFSLGIMGICFYFFAWQAAGRKKFWLSNLDQEVYFAITRNAVTLAGALVVGVTLFFSYRKQQTAENTQKLAQEAHGVAQQTLQLSLDKHGLEEVSELRNRYARSAEQLASEKTAVTLAGIHSLVALSDDWLLADNKKEQQVCVSLLCSYLSSFDQQPSRLDDRLIRKTGWSVIAERLRVTEPGGWGASEVALTSVALPDHALTNFTIHSGGRLLVLDAPWPSKELVISGLKVLDGRVLIRPIPAGESVARLVLARSTFSNGSFGLEISDAPKTLRISQCHFDGTRVRLDMQGYSHIEFNNCVFTSGSIKISIDEPADISFRRCTFEQDIFTVIGCEPDALTVRHRESHYASGAEGKIRVGPSQWQRSEVVYGKNGKPQDALIMQTRLPFSPNLETEDE